MQFDLYSFKKSLSPFIDGMGVIAQGAPGRDGGDSCHRTSVIVTALNTIGEHGEAVKMYYDNLKAFKASETEYRRHPDPKRWYSRPENFSRDQTSMLLAAAASVGDRTTVVNIAKQLFKNKGFHQNSYPNYAVPGDVEYKKKTPDIIAPSEISAIIRGADVLIAYPLLWALDAFFFVDVLFAALDDRVSKKKRGRTDQYVMLAAHLGLASKKMDTPVAALARKFMSKFDYKGTFEHIFATPELNDPPVHKVLIPMCEKIL